MQPGLDNRTSKLLRDSSTQIKLPNDCWMCISNIEWPTHPPSTTCYWDSFRPPPPPSPTSGHLGEGGEWDTGGFVINARNLSWIHHVCTWSDVIPTFKVFIERVLYKHLSYLLNWSSRLKNKPSKNPYHLSFHGLDRSYFIIQERRMKPLVLRMFSLGLYKDTWCCTQGGGGNWLKQD